MTGVNFQPGWIVKDTEYIIDDGKHPITSGSYVRDYIGNNNGGVFQFTGDKESN